MSKIKNQVEAASVIGAGMVISGDVSFSGLLQLEGTIEGSLRGDRAEIAPTGRVEGDVTLVELDCRGAVRGRVTADRLSLRHSGKLTGTLVSRELDMAPGALLSGPTTVSGASSASGKPQEPATTAAASSPKNNRVISAGRNTYDNEDDEDREPDLKASVDSLIMALRGGSRLIVVISEQAETRRLFHREARAQLSSHYKLVNVDDPSGSVRDILIRIAQALHVKLRDYNDNKRMREDLLASLAASASKGRPSLLFVENGEKMYPATLEGLLRHLADDIPESEIMGLVLVGDGGLKKMKDIDNANVPMRRPDCIFEL